MRSYLILVGLAASAWALAPDAAEAQRGGARRTSGYAAVGPMGGVSAGRQSTAVASGPFGSAATTTRTGTRVTPGGATV